MEKKVIKGYNYAATSATEATIVDDNGLVLCEVEAGKQGYFTATSDLIDVGSADVVITQIRGNFNLPITAGGGGGGQSFPEGAIVGIGPNGAYTSIGEHITQGGTMFYNNTTLTEWYGDLPNMTDAYDGYKVWGMFRGCSNLTKFVGEMPSLSLGGYMFYGCSNLTEFRCSSMPSLTSGGSMFYGCSGLTEFRCDMPSLTSGSQMFNGCTGLTTIESDLSSWNGGRLFTSVDNIKTIKADLSSYKPDGSMYTSFFAYMSKLEWFEGSLRSAVKTDYLLLNAPKVKHFKTDLSSLTSAQSMFSSGSKLDKETVESIVNTIKDLAAAGTTGYITLPIDSTQITQAEQDAFNAIITGKGWTTTWKRN